EREDVRAEHALDLGVRDLEEGLVRRLRGRVVHEDVEATELLERPLDHATAVSRIAEIAADRGGAAPGRLDEARRLLGVGLLVEMRDQHIGALTRERDCDGAPDAAVATSHDGGEAFELAAPAVRLLAVVGSGTELG